MNNAMWAVTIFGFCLVVLIIWEHLDTKAYADRADDDDEGDAT